MIHYPSQSAALQAQNIPREDLVPRASFLLNNLIRLTLLLRRAKVIVCLPNNTVRLRQRLQAFKTAQEFNKSLSRSYRYTRVG